MTDPVSGQAASQAVETISSNQQVEGTKEASSDSNFSDLMNTESVENADAVAEVDAEIEVQSTEQIEEVNEIPTDDFIQSILKEEDRISAMMEKCMSGAAMGQEEMLQMQALIYSYSQRVDLTTKVVDKATGGVQQVMNTQV